VCREIADAGVHNIVSAGNTGEFFALTDDEVERVHAAAIEGVAGKAVVTAAIGRSLSQAKRTARLAMEAGADAVMSHHPLDPFAAPASQVDYFLALAETVTLPLVAYVRTDTIAVNDLLRLARHPNVAGIKFASTNLALLAECIRQSEADQNVWVCGLAESWAPPFYALGAQGFTSGLVNVLPALSLDILASLRAGDEARTRALINKIAPFEALRTLYNNGANVTVVKEAMALLGRNVGPVRLPGLPRLGEGAHAKLRDIVEDWQQALR